MKNKFHRSLALLSMVFITSLFLNGCASTSNLKWEQMFNGKDLDDWTVKIRNYPANENFGNTFRVNDGQIQVRYDGYTNFNEQFGHLFYNKPYSTYLIGVEYRFIGDQVEGGPGWAYRNSGIMAHGQNPADMTLDQDFPDSMEIQLLGGNGKDPRTTANLCTPGTQYELDGKIITQHCTNSTSKTFHGDQWVRVEVLAIKDSLFVHYVNGEEVMRYNKPQLDPVNGKGGAGELLKGGTISLQSESHPVDFRKVEIIDLEKVADNPKKLKETIDKLMAKKRVPKQ